MRRQKNREINIFSMSALDLFASALGAFILITVAALPYYLNNVRVSNNFFVITMSWESNNKDRDGKTLGQDVDLHIVDPNNNEYYYKHREYKNSKAKLTLDSINVPNGNEIWTDDSIQSKGVRQRWEVYYVGWSIQGKPVKVEGALYTSLGTSKFKVKYISQNRDYKVHVATVIVTKDGNLKVKTY